MNSEENNEAKRQLKAMEMNILSLNSNSFQSNNGSDEDLPAMINPFSNDLKDKQDDHEDNSSNNSAAENSSVKASSSRRRKSVKPFKVNQLIKTNETIVEQQDTEEDSSRSDQISIFKEEALDDEDSNNGSNNDE